MHCDRCGRQNPPDAAFCNNPSCGAYLGWSEEAHDRPAAPRTSEPPVAPQAPASTGAPIAPGAPGASTRGPLRPPTATPPPAPVAPTVAPTAAPTVAPAGVGGLTIAIEPATVAADPGASALVRLRVRNTTSLVQSAVLGVRGLPPGWVSIQPPEVNIYTDAEADATVTLSPPLSAKTPPGPMVFGVVAASRVDPALQASTTGTLTVGAFDQVAVELMPTESEGKRSASHRLLIANRGNRPRSVAIEAVDRAERLTFEVPASVTVAAGTDTVVPVALSARRRQWSGPPRRHAFSLRIDGEERPQTQGVFNQLAALPRGLLPALAALLAITLAVGVPLGIRELNRNDQQKAAQAKQQAAAVPVEVPNVVGSSFTDALAALAQAGLTGERAARTQPVATDAEADKVAATEPAAHTEVPRGSTVGLVMTIGPGKATVPYVIGSSADAARALLQQQGLGNVLVAAIRQPSSDVAADLVVDCVPAAGSEVERTRSVTLVLSSGSPPATIPIVIGKASAEAQAALTAAKFKVRPKYETREITDQTLIGKVVDWTADGVDANATEAPEGTAFTLVVGVGPASVKVPSLAGLKLDTANQQLTAANLTPGSQTLEASKTVAAGSVIRSVPDAGTELAVGTAVELVVSNGPPVPVPNVVGKTVGEATAVLTAAGLAAAPAAWCDATATVAGQEPATGEVMAGSAVALGCKVAYVVPHLTIPAALVPALVTTTTTTTKK